MKKKYIYEDVMLYYWLSLRNGADKKRLKS